MKARTRFAIILTITTSFMLMLSCISVFADDNIVDSGECGENLTWELSGVDSTELTLTISGNGPMEDFTEESIPWAGKRSRIKTVVVGEGVTHIGSYAFYSLNKTTDVILPESLLSIGNDAFNECSKLINLNLPSNVNAIYIRAFRNCSSLNTITFPDSVNYIGTYAFEKCTSLRSINIENVESIGEGAFCDCSSLTDIGTISHISCWEFANCTNLNAVVFSQDEDINCIPNGAFYGCSKLESVNIPSKVTIIEQNAFENCTNLKEISIPDSISSIKMEAFEGCVNLKKVYYTGDIETWLKIQFKKSSNPLSSGASLYINDTEVTEVVFPDGITTIEDYVFNGCESLEKITIPDSVTTIGSWAFYGCNNLDDFIIPDSVRIIGYQTFSECTSLTNITILDGAELISNYAFYGCSNLEHITIPKSVNTIYTGAFSNCPKLTIICDEGSYAMTYAIDNSLRYDLPTGHQFDAGIITQQPTSTNTGIRTYTCYTCKATKTEVIPQLPPTIPPVAQPTEINDLPSVKIAKPKAAKKSTTIKWKKVSKKNLKKTKKVEIQYSLDPSFSTGVITKIVNAKKTSVKIKGLAKGSTYYVRLRANNANGHISSWSGTKSFKAK